MRRMLWYLIAGTRGGANRAKIINFLNERPYNINQLAEILEVDYKTIKYHIDVLEENEIVTPSGEKYGTMYFLTTKMIENYDTFQEIWAEVVK
ncbi:MAG: winged helix-turn-helix domain-containing protein [Methanobacterium sp. ERen5]|nr:MAG: winged helix-turn-helix domain-containing protein [Methanobacterium sp. ERen5]